MISLAPELDGRFAKLYAYLQNDLTKKQPSVGMIIDLLCTGLEEKLEARKYFSPSAAKQAYFSCRGWNRCKSSPAIKIR